MNEDRSTVASASTTTAVVATTATGRRRRRRRRARPVVAGGGAAAVLTAAATVSVSVILLLFSMTAMIVFHSHVYCCATNTAFIVGTVGRGERTRSSVHHYAAGSGRVRSISTSANGNKDTVKFMSSCRTDSENDEDEDEGNNYDSSSKCGSSGTFMTVVSATTTRRQAIKVFVTSSMISSSSFLLPSVQNNIDDDDANNNSNNNINSSSSNNNKSFNHNNVVANALTPTEAEDAYDKYAPTYNQLDGDDQVTSLLGIDEARTELFRQASGRVLEIGCGTGLNLPRYDYSKISSLTLMDISQGMINEAQKRLEEDPTLRNLISSNNVQIEFIQGDATSQLVEKFSTSLDDGDRIDSTSSSFSSSSSQPLLFDTVVDSFSLCVMGNDGAKRCLQQMSTVVKPTTGRILLLENSRSSNNVLGWYQDITASNAATMGGKGCVYNQDVRSMIENVRDPYPKLQIIKEQQYAAGLFRSFECRRV